MMPIINRVNKKDESEDAVTSVVGEMLMIAISIVLVGIFAITAYALVPDERTQTITVGYDFSGISSDHKLVFWHKGGDWIEASELTLTITDDSGHKYPALYADVYDPIIDSNGHETFKKVNTFDLGGKAEFILTGISLSSGKGYSLRLLGKDGILWASDEVKLV